MHKSLFGVMLVLAGMQSAQALNAGDIAFTGFDALDPDGFSFVALTNIAANTSISFTDNNWQGANFTTSEGTLTWSSGNSGVSAGSVVVFSGPTSGVTLASQGEVSGKTGSFLLKQSGESLYAYQGSLAAPNILAAMTADGSGDSLITGLSSGASLLTLTSNTTFAQYTGARSGLNQAAFRVLLGDTENWSYTSATTLNATAFSIMAVPEPGSTAMLLSGLGVLGFMVKRRRTFA